MTVHACMWNVEWVTGLCTHNVHVCPPPPQHTHTHILPVTSSDQEEAKQLSEVLRNAAENPPPKPKTALRIKVCVYGLSP